MEYLLLTGLVLCAVLLVGGGLTLYQLVLQNGRILTRLDEVDDWLMETVGPERGIEDFLGTLPVGAPAPPINLPDLNGVPRVLAEWRGRRVLLVFFDPACTFSRRLLPALVALQSDPVPGRPLPVLVSTGDLEENRRLFDEAGFVQPVLLQKSTEVAAAFKVDGTPMSYLIEADGTLASELTAGVQATLILAGEMASVTDATETEHRGTSPDESARTHGPPVLRTGLKPGATAPIFRLPNLRGGEVSLLDYRGRDLLVVFVDPECEACDLLWPALPAANNATNSTAILLISRGDIEPNLAMVQRHGLELPVALQRHWEISREYGMFAVPSAFHVDEWGVVAAGVAVGQEEVLELITRVAASRTQD